MTKLKGPDIDSLVFYSLRQPQHRPLVCWGANMMPQTTENFAVTKSLVKQVEKLIRIVNKFLKTNYTRREVKREKRVSIASWT